MIKKIQSWHLAAFQIWLELKMWRRLPSLMYNVGVYMVKSFLAIVFFITVLAVFRYTGIISQRVLLASTWLAMVVSIWHMALRLRHSNFADFTPEQQESIEKQVESQKDKLTAKVIRQNKEVLEAFVPRADTDISSNKSKKLTHKI